MYGQHHFDAMSRKMAQNPCGTIFIGSLCSKYDSAILYIDGQ
jgi:hypothetical protein